MAGITRGPLLGISVLIVGGGIGGLTAALECWRSGCDVVVLERAKGPLMTGDSFTIGPSALGFLKHFPELSAQNDAIAYHPKVAYHRHTGERIAGPIALETIVSGADSGTKVQRDLVRHSRRKLYTIMLQQIEKLGIEVRYDCEVIEYHEDQSLGQAWVVTKNHSKHEADLVIAADGVHGKSWVLVAGKPVPARPSGKAVYRAAYPVELAISDPVIAERFPFDKDGNSIGELWSGPGITTTFWRNDEEMQWVLTHPDTGTAEESWSQRVDPENVIRFLETIPDWPEYANRVIRATPPDRLVDWKLMWRDPQPKWTSPAGLVLQLGDAAHTFLPSSGNGAVQAMEDAISIAACLRRAGHKSAIPEATRVHNLLRSERVSCLQAFGVRNASERDSSVKGQDTDKTMQVKVGKWMVDHDPEDYASRKYEEAIAHLKTGSSFANTNTPPGLEYQPWTIDGLMDAAKRGEKTVFDADWS